MTSRIAAWALVIAFCTSARSLANGGPENFEAVAVDLVVARPCWLVATVVGTGLFIVSLPVAAMSKSVNKTARTLVAKPAQATFTRPLGDFSTLE
ncbi:MAG TPA: hypothetical protein VEO95_08180 [Chthoniobacteraceae bacterium]|nr:hypothetical protein [Chthoniobacteraceae bacterium]